ncbi:hypothetical protein GCK72_018772 [Caenorhabditis remanei]|uniref:Uncharacterized protein n=2 Tax=Caenorhabditis remanei TaxID=31234 RepID=A0A6A5GAS9_CAERE|nr:hypothetical protein GCK72_018772 [Caenorhabditis remanei]KAF1752218.1 hypothetical protein GCK72_018772 [Caenorhabditis remanei]
MSKLSVNEGFERNRKNENKKKIIEEQKKEGQPDVKNKDENEKQKSGGRSKSKSKKEIIKSTLDGDTSSGKKKKESKVSKPAEEVQGDVKAGTTSGKEKIAALDGDVIPADLCGEMDKTINDSENPAVHDRVTRIAETDLIFDPKVVKYRGNVDEEKNKSEVEQLEKEMEAACAKHERRVRNKTRKSEESVKSVDTPVPTDRRVKMKPDACVLFETKEQLTDDEAIDRVEEDDKEQ